MKSIYDEAIEILLNMGAEFISVPCNPIGEENSDMIHLRDATETYEANMHEVVKALEQAQKQEKLLELYRKLDDCIVAPTGHHVCRYTDDEKYARIRKQIKELENNTKESEKDDMKYRKKPVVIEAVQFNGRNSADIHEFCGDKVREPVGKDYLEIKTLEGIHIASTGDYIIKGVNGEFYPCKPDIFEKTYEKVD